MKTKHCPKCDLELPRYAFTSTRAKFCISCKRIRELEQAQESKQRSIARLKTKKQKTKGVIRISDLKKKAQKIFNKWIRERDKDLPCISCQKTADKYEAGHYIAQGSSGYLRYNEDNVHGQCKACNRWNHGNLIEYRINLIKKVGLKTVEWLEEHRKDTKKWTREELEEIIEKYR